MALPILPAFLWNEILCFLEEGVSVAKLADSHPSFLRYLRRAWNAMYRPLIACPQWSITLTHPDAYTVRELWLIPASKPRSAFVLSKYTCSMLVSETLCLKNFGLATDSTSKALSVRGIGSEATVGTGMTQYRVGSIDISNIILDNVSILSNRIIAYNVTSHENRFTTFCGKYIWSDSSTYDSLYLSAKHIQPALVQEYASYTWSIVNCNIQNDLVISIGACFTSLRMTIRNVRLRYLRIVLLSLYALPHLPYIEIDTDLSTDQIMYNQHMGGIHVNQGELVHRIYYDGVCVGKVLVKS